MGVSIGGSIGPISARYRPGRSIARAAGRSGRSLPRTEREVEYMLPIYALIWGAIIALVALVGVLAFVVNVLPVALGTVVAWIIMIAIFGGIPLALVWYLGRAFMEGWRDH